ncbi:MAG: hypothetical protein KAT90_02860, partial [Gammaproteobacteria bacterium]|nr:hypothetical protein [Gammaproteobacteria bacterium]
MQQQKSVLHRVALSIAVATAFFSSLNIAMAAPGDPVGGETQANDYIDSSQRQPVIAMSADGDFTIAWASEEQDGELLGVFFKRYRTSGVSSTPDTQAHIFTLFDQDDQSIAMNANGDFVIAWESFGQEPDTGGQNTTGIFARLYNRPGEPLGDEFLVNITNISADNTPSVAMDADGDFVVVWNRDDFSIRVRRYDKFGMAQGVIMEANQDAPSRLPHDPVVAMDADGDFVVVWWESDINNSDGAVVALRYDAQGNESLQGIIPVDQTLYNSQEKPDVAMNMDGDFVIVWTDQGELDQNRVRLNDSSDGSKSGVFMRCYDALGVPNTDEVQVNTTSDGVQEEPVIGMASDGSFVVAWEGASQDGTGKGIFAQRFNSDCTSNGDEFVVNTFLPGQQESPDVAVDADGDFIITWHSTGQVGGIDEEIYYQRYSGDASIDLSLVADNGDQIFANVEGELEYSFIVTNNAASPDLSGDADKDLYLSQVGAASGVTVKVELDDGATFDGYTGTDWSCSGDDINITCIYGGSLVPSASTTVVLDVTMPETPTKFAVTSVVSSDQTDPDTTNNTFDVGVNISGEGGAGSGSMSWLFALLALLPALLRSSVKSFDAKKKRKSLFATLSALCLLLMTGNAQAVDFAGNAGLASKKMDFGRSTDINSTDVTFTMINLSFTTILDSSYVSFAVELPTSEEDSNNGLVTSDRDEVSLTWGCNCIPNLENVNVFVGYTSTGTDITGSVPGEAFTEKHVDKGFFIGGLVPVLDVDEKRISLSVAYAALDGEIDFTDEFTGVSGTIDGDTAG